MKRGVAPRSHLDNAGAHNTFLRMRYPLAFAAALLCLSVELSTASATQVLADMPYAEARSLLLRKGWRPVHNEAHASQCGSAAAICDRYPETASCSPQAASCTFQWSHGSATAEIVTSGTDASRLQVTASRCLNGCIKVLDIAQKSPPPTLVMPKADPPSAKEAAVEPLSRTMSVPCQRSAENGKILIDADAIPDGARYDVEAYKPNRQGEAWALGRCVIRLKSIQAR